MVCKEFAIRNIMHQPAMKGKRLDRMDDFSIALLLRNKFAHHYPEESRKQLDKLNLLIEEAGFVVEVFDGIVHYAEDKRFLPPGNP